MGGSSKKDFFKLVWNSGLWRHVAVVHSLSHVWLFATPWTATCHTSFSFTISWSLFILMSLESVMPSTYLIHCWPFSSCLQSFPASGSFPMSWLFASGSQGIGASASSSVLPVNNQDWFPLGLTGLISLQSKGLSRVFSSTTIWNHQFFGAQPCLWSNSHICITTGKTLTWTIHTFVSKLMGKQWKQRKTLFWGLQMVTAAI